MNDFEERLRKDARRLAIDAVNAAISWQAHPTFDTKSSIITRLRNADSMLLLVAAADWFMGARVVCGIDRSILFTVEMAVSQYKRGDASIAPYLVTLAAEMVVGEFDTPSAS